MNMIIENCDVYSEVLYDILHVLAETIYDEERTYEHNVRIRNILDDLDNFNITMQINGINMIQYTMLLSMKNIEIEKLESNSIRFADLNLIVEEDKQEYLKLTDWYKELRNILETRFDLPDELIQYIEPNCRLVNVRLSMSIKEFVYFIISCAKYDELMDIMVLISNYDELYDLLVSISTMLNDIILVDDLFIRTMLDPENREELMYYEGTEVYVISSEPYINHCLKNNKADVKLSTLGTCSLIAYRDIVKALPKQQIKIENLQYALQGDKINTLLPMEYRNIDEFVVAAIHQYAQAWYNFSKKLNPLEYSNEIILCSLGCFTNVFKMNTMIENYFKLHIESELSEVREIMETVQQKIMGEQLGGN